MGTESSTAGTRDGAEEADVWDVVVVGAGPVGEVAAQYAVQGTDLTAVLVEQERLGGECSYWACMPSKALLRPVEIADEARGLPGVPVGTLDAAAILARRDSVVHGPQHDDAGQVTWAKGIGIDVVRGTGRLVGERRVEVRTSDGGVRTLTARHAVVLATGSRAAIPPVEGLADALPWTSRDVTNLHEVPRRVLLVGGGVVACEAATWLSGLGAEQVVVVQRGPRLLPALEPFASAMVLDALRERGVDVRLDTTPSSVSREAAKDTGEGYVHGGEVTVRLSDGSEVTVDEVVVAAGRTPNSGNLGLDVVGLAEEARRHRGYVPIDEHLQVPGFDWLYAVGDLSGPAPLTHMGKYQARAAGRVIAARATGRDTGGAAYALTRDLASYGAVPQVVFTSPPVAAVGRTEEQARADGVDVETVEYDAANVAGAYLLAEHYIGRAKLVVDRAAQVLVGATFVGAGTQELLHSATVAVVAKVPLDALWHAVPSYPTVSEVWLRLLETLDAQRRE